MDWMCQNFWPLNTDKSTIIILGHKDEQSKVISHLKLIKLKAADQARNVGVDMEPDLNSNNQIKTVTKSA